MAAAVKPFPYQKIGALKIEEFGGRAWLADEMGLGKTYQALLWAKWNPEARPVVVVCPASLKENWERETLHKINLRSEILNGTKPPKMAGMLVAPVLIINYEILAKWLPYLKSIKPKLVIIDEAHRIKNMDAKCTKAVQKLCKRVPHVVALSGTPMLNRIIEMFPTLNILRPDMFPSFWDYANEYCEPERTPYGWRFNGARNVKQLHKLLRKNVMIRRLKSEVLSELPQMSRHIVPMTLAESDRKHYDEAYKDFIRFLQRQHGSVKANKAKKAEELARTMYMRKLIGEMKTKPVSGWIDEFLQETDEKLILFGVHQDVIKVYQERYPNINVVVNGLTPMQKRMTMVDRFQKDPKCRLFIGNIQAAGVGLNLTAASAVAFAELGWTPGEHSQAEKRADRIGQKLPVRAYYLLVQNSIEEKMCKLIQSKQKVLSQTLDGTLLEEDLNIHDQLVQELLKEQRT